VDLLYDPDFKAGGATRLFIIDCLKPIQQPSTEIDEYVAARGRFTRDEWLDVLLRTTGLEPTHPDFTLRKKMFHLMRLVPMVKPNYNLIELGSSVLRASSNHDPCLWRDHDAHVAGEPL